jgi:hypothetical protein
MTKRWFWALALAASVGLAGCGDDDDDDGGAAAPPPTTTPPPTGCQPPATATVTFSGVVHPILIAKCGGCHGTTFGSSTRATAYAAAQTRVNTTTPAQSILIQKGNNEVTHAGGDQLTAAEVTSITTWVTECAQNN